MQKNCIVCHTIKGLVSKGTVAPDLTHLASRETLAAGVFANTPANLFKWIKNPQAIKPGCHMPYLHLTDNEVKELTAFLGGLK